MACPPTLTGPCAVPRRCPLVDEDSGLGSPECPPRPARAGTGKRSQTRTLLPCLAGPRGGTRPADVLKKPVPHRAPEPPPQTPGGLTLPGESAEKVAGSTEQCLGFGTQGDARGQREAGWAGQLGQHRRAVCETQLRRALWREHVGPREGRSRHGHSARPGLCPSSLWSTDPEHPEHRTVATQGPGATGVGRARRGRGCGARPAAPQELGLGSRPAPLPFVP